MYKSIIRPCLFRIDAEKIHDQIITLLHISSSGSNKKPYPLTVSPQGCFLPVTKSDFQ